MAKRIADSLVSRTPPNVTGDTQVPATTRDPAGEYASFVTRTTYEDLPPELVDFLKRRVLDTLAVWVAGSEQRGIAEVLEYVRECGGAPQSTVLVYSDKAPAAMAAFVNGPMARALDMGDVHDEGEHMSEYIVPVLFALAEMRGGATGKEFLTAYCVGGEVQGRIGNACLGLSKIERYGKKVNYNQWGAICAGAKLLGFDFDTTWNAIGIGYSALGSSDWQSTAEGNLMKRFQHAFTCADAVHCLALAQKGIMGTRNVFLGPRGFLSTHYFLENNPAQLTSGLGKTWEWTTNTGTKAYACCYFSHACMWGAVSLMREHSIAVRDVEAIHCAVHPTARATAAEPKALKWNPTTMTEGQFSLPYSVATVVIKGRLMPADYAEEEMKRHDVRELMQKITVSARSADVPVFGGIVTVALKDGRKYTRTVDYPYGHAKNPMSWDDEIVKFHECAAYSAKPIPEANLNKVVDICQRLEHIEDVTEIVRLLSPR